MLQTPVLPLLLLLCCISRAQGAGAYSRHAWRRVYNVKKPPSFQRTLATVSLLSSRKEYSWAVQWQELMDAESENKTQQAAQVSASPAVQKLLQCLNTPAPGQAHAPTSWASIKAGQLGRLKAIAATSHDSSTSSCPVTVVTFSTLDRLNQLHAQCRKWPGPLSVALYEPILQPDGDTALSQASKARLRFAVEQVMQVAAELSHMPDACQLDILLVYEVISDAAALPLVPLNQLRNLARIPVRTPLVALLDVDLLPSRSLYDRVMATREYLMQQVSSKAVFIIPAFDLGTAYQMVDWAQALASLKNKKVLLTCLEEELVVTFNFKWPRHHRMTKYKHWTHASVDYDTQYEAWAEPWMVASRTGIPWYDERYRGYGGDKLQHTLALNQTGHSFKVLHDAFLIHRPHKPAGAKALYKSKSTSKDGVAGLGDFVNGLFQDQMDQPAGAPYKPVLSHSLNACQRSLPWWKLGGR